MADLPDASPQVSVYEQLEHAIKGSTIVFCCLSDDAAVNELLAKLLQLDIKGVLFVDCSTVHPETTSNTETRLKDAGAMFVAMPVFGAVSVATPLQLHSQADFSIQPAMVRFTSLHLLALLNSVLRRRAGRRWHVDSCPRWTSSSRRAGQALHRRSVSESKSCSPNSLAEGVATGLPKRSLICPTKTPPRPPNSSSLATP